MSRLKISTNPLKNLYPPLTAENFSGGGFFNAFLMFQLLVTVYAVCNAAPGFETDKIGLFGRPDPQEGEFAHMNSGSHVKFFQKAVKFRRKRGI